MRSWKDNASYPLKTVVDALGADYRKLFDTNSGLPVNKFKDFVTKLNAKSAPLACYTVDAIAKMLKDHGPLLVIHNPTGDPNVAMLHAMVVSKMKGDGTLDGTMVTYVDPADGKEHKESCRVFLTKYESAAAEDVQIQIIHY